MNNKVMFRADGFRRRGILRNMVVGINARATDEDAEHQFFHTA